jgi:hypothetical protein
LGEETVAFGTLVYLNATAPYNKKKSEAMDTSDFLKFKKIIPNIAVRDK